MKNRKFTEKAVLQMRTAIAEAGGNEVFFLGCTDETELVVEAEPLASSSLFSSSLVWLHSADELGTNGENVLQRAGTDLPPASSA